MVKRLHADDEIGALVHHINDAVWDEANEMTSYSEGALRAYLEKSDTVFIACYGDSDALLGIASARLEMKPYDRELWLYVDEVDVCADKRRQGAATAMMNHLLEFAADSGCSELWLGTEIDNVAAQALYQSLEPDEVERFVGYTYEVDSTEFS